MRNIKIWHLPPPSPSSACWEKFFSFLSRLPFFFVPVVCSTFPAFSPWLGGGSPGVATLKIHHISSLLRGSFKYILILVNPVLILSDAIFLIFSESGTLSFVKSPWLITVFFIDHRILWKWKINLSMRITKFPVLYRKTFMNSVCKQYLSSTHWYEK